MRRALGLAWLLAAAPACALDARELAVIVNTRDPLSVEIGQAYAAARSLPAKNLIEVAFETSGPVLPESEFLRIKQTVDAAAGATGQALATTWAAPYRVDCMSVTSAFAFGFNHAYCAKGCKPTAVSPLFNVSTSAPYTDFGIRPTMAIAARTKEQALHLIARGVAADGGMPSGTAYFVSTPDAARNARHFLYPLAVRIARRRIGAEHLHADALTAKSDVLFYFTGAKFVAGLATLGFRPGAIADHLTSYGGRLTDSPQMSALAWLGAGATASYGAVVEPCNFPQKFPNPVVVVERYLDGASALEAYWASVMMPGQGIFIGEPLAAPFRPQPAAP
jgi:uncharacterized protein (TIGR03790 family)